MEVAVPKRLQAPLCTLTITPKTWALRTRYIQNPEFSSTLSVEKNLDMFYKEKKEQKLESFQSPNSYRDYEGVGTLMLKLCSGFFLSLS